MLNFLTNLFSALAPLWEMSLTAAFAAAVVLVLRLILKRRAPRQAVCLLWLIVFARLLLPFSLESPVSLVPQALTEQTSPAVSQPADDPAQAPIPTPEGAQSPSAAFPAVSAQIPVASSPVSTAEPQAPLVTPPVADEESSIPWKAVAAGVWLAGAAAMLLYGVFSYVRLRRRVFDAIRAQDGAWEHPAVRSPFILGLFRPKIYLPAGLGGPAREFTLCHERTHLKRLDYIVKPICWLALALHWFNPMAWAAFLLMSRDMEVACDQAVIRRLGNEVKADYSATLLSLATGGRFPAPCPLAFGEGDAKARIKSVLSYKKPTLWIIIAAVVVAIVAAVCLLTNPKAPAAENPEPSPTSSVQPTEPPALPTGPDGAELTLLDMDVVSGARLYRDSQGLTVLSGSGHIGYVYINGEALNLNAAGQYGAENLYASLLYCKTDSDGNWQVTVELKSDTNLLATAFLYWCEPEQVWSTNRPGVTVTPVTLLEGSTDYYTGFELDTPVGSRSFTGAHVDGQPILTYYSDLTGDGVGDYIVMLHPGEGTGPVKHDLHIFDGVTLEEYDTSGVWRLIPEMAEFASDEGNYYITAPGFTAAVSKNRVRADLPETELLDTMRLIEEYRWLSMDNGKLCVSYACMVGGYWTSYGTLQAELAVVDGTLAVQRCCYIAPDGTVTGSTGPLTSLPSELVTLGTLPLDPEEYYLVARLPEENIWLYSRNYGQETLLIRNGYRQSYDYAAHTAHMVLPRMAMLDTDCVGVISLIGTGTGVNEEELVVYDLRDLSDWRDYRYDWTSAAAEFNRNNTLVYDGNANSLAVTYGGVTYHTGTLTEDLGAALDLEDGFTGAAIADGSIVSYQFNEDGTVRITLPTCVARGGQGHFDEEGFWHGDGDENSTYPVSAGVTGIELTWAVRFTGSGFEAVPGSLSVTPKPLSLDTLQNHLAAGTEDFYAIRADGTLVMWGSPEYVLAGSNMSGVPVDTPLELMEDAVYVSAAMGRVMVIDKNGTLWGLGTMADPAAPNQPRRLMEHVAMVSCGQYDTLVLKQDGTLWSCDPFSPGLPGLETQTVDGVTFEKLLDNVTYVEAGGLGSGAVVLADDTEWKWVWDQDSGLEKATGHVYTPRGGQFSLYGVKIDSVADSAHGEFASIFLKNDGTLWQVTSDGVLTDISSVLR